MQSNSHFQCISRGAARIILSGAFLGCLALAQETVAISEPQAVKAAIKKVEPEYPAMAKQLRLTGRVQVTAAVDAEGNVDKVEIVSGNPLFTKAAVAAVEKWKFTPFHAEGKPVKAVVHLSFSFGL